MILPKQNSYNQLVFTIHVGIIIFLIIKVMIKIWGIKSLKGKE